MPTPFDTLRYVTQDNPIQQSKIFDDIQRIKDNRFRQQQLTENARQFDVSNERTDRHQTTAEEIQREGEAGRNSRFRLTLEDTKQARKEARDDKKQKQIVDMTAQINSLLSAGKEREAFGLFGAAANLGIKINIKKDNKTGRNIYELKAPAFDSKPGTYELTPGEEHEVGKDKQKSASKEAESAKQKAVNKVMAPEVSASAPSIVPPVAVASANIQKPSNQPSLPLPDIIPTPEDYIRNRGNVVNAHQIGLLQQQLGNKTGEELLAAAAGAGANLPGSDIPDNVQNNSINTAPAPPQTATPPPPPVPPQAAAPPPPPVPPQAAAPPPPPVPPQAVAPPPQYSEVNPNAIDMNMMADITQRQMAPITQGLINTFPGAYQNRVKGIVEGAASSGRNLDDVMEMVKHPMTTAASLVRGEMAERGASQRAWASQSRGDNSEERAWFNIGKSEAQNIISAHKVKDRIQSHSSFNTMISNLKGFNEFGELNPDGSKNHHAQIDGINAMIKLKQDRITDQDFLMQIGGWASKLQKIEDFISLLSVNGLTPDQERNLVGLAKKLQAQDKEKAYKAYVAFRKSINSAKHASQAEAIERSMRSVIPEEYIVESEIRRKKEQEKSVNTHESSSVGISSSNVKQEEPDDPNSGFEMFGL